MNNYKFAGDLLQWIKSLLMKIGVSPSLMDQLEDVIYVLIILLFALLFSWGMRITLHYIIPRIWRKNRGTTLQILMENRVFSKATHLIPPLIILTLLPFAFEYSPELMSIIERFCWIYVIIAFIIYSRLFLYSLLHIFSKSDTLKNRPLKAIVQIIQGVLIGLAVIAIVSLLVNRSPLNLITGLGAFAAVLMLIFKDSIMGFVAGVQLSQNDMIRHGDWIVMADNMVNGVVIDITLNTVKVQNFDNTIVTIPPYSLISGSFQNWRGMSESGGRRIMRGYTIDLNTIRFCSPEMLEELKKIPLLRDYIVRKQEEQQAGKVENTDNSQGLVNGTIETNLGLLRAYMAIYLQQHAFVNNSLTLMVRTLTPTQNGMPLELYCFSANKNWPSYESIQSEIMEHFAAIMPSFGLYPFQNATGRDYINSALITAGSNIDTLTDIPWKSLRQETLADPPTDPPKDPGKE